MRRRRVQRRRHGPVSKDRLARIGYAYPGQTEFFAARWAVSRRWRFAAASCAWCCSRGTFRLRDVPAQLTTPNFTRAVRAAEVLCRAGLPNPAAQPGMAGFGDPALQETGRSSARPPYVPRIGVCGLNPHAGEAGLLGSEERDIIDPILTELRRTHPGLSRCEPGDTLFGRQLRGEFDVVIALYHDQGLAPLKVIDFDEAVNVTLGLAHVRTSPDHGTAYGIAGQGLASPRSFANAVAVPID